MKKGFVFLFVLAFLISSSVVCVFAYTADLADFDLFIASLSAPVDQDDPERDEIAIVGLDEDVDEFAEFQIINGLADTTSVTFDRTREIYGESLKGTVVVFDVYTFDEEQESFDLDRSYELEVGASGLFRKEIPLNLDTNYLLITATYDDLTVQKTAVIKRKDLEIKYELERGIVFPGQNFFVR